MGKYVTISLYPPFSLAGSVCKFQIRQTDDMSEMQETERFNGRELLNYQRKRTFAKSVEAQQIQQHN